MSKHEPQKYEVNGFPLKCPACGNELFYERKAFIGQRKVLEGQLNVMNRTCSQCGHIMLFDPYPGAP